MENNKELRRRYIQWIVNCGRLISFITYDRLLIFGFLEFFFLLNLRCTFSCFVERNNRKIRSSQGRKQTISKANRMFKALSHNESPMPTAYSPHLYHSHSEKAAASVTYLDVDFRQTLSWAVPLLHIGSCERALRYPLYAWLRKR